MAIKTTHYILGSIKAEAICKGSWYYNSIVKVWQGVEDKSDTYEETLISFEQSHLSLERALEAQKTKAFKNTLKVITKYHSTLQ